MLNNRQTTLCPHFIGGKEPCLCYTPDFRAEEKLYKEFGQNNEIDIMRNNPQYEGVVNSKLREVNVNTLLDTSDLTDAQRCEGVAFTRSWDSNEVNEYLSKDRESLQNEISE